MENKTLRPPLPSGERIEVRGKPNCPPSPQPSPASGRGKNAIFMGRGCPPSHEDSLVVQTGLLVARVRKQAPKPKRAGRIFPTPPRFVSAKRRGGKGVPGLKRRKPASGKEGSPPFLARRMLFCPGMGQFGHKDFSLFVEPAENTSFSKRSPVFFSTKLKMISISSIAAMQR